MSKWIEFKLIKELPKTKVYEVRNKEYNYFIGTIKWYPGWRKYAFFPVGNILFEQDCLTDIVNFLDELMEEKKK